MIEPMLANSGGQLVHEGRERTFQIHTPPGYNSRQKFPIVIVLHGGASNANIIRRQTQMDAASDKYGFVAVYPEGTCDPKDAALRLFTWNGGTCCGWARDKKVDDVGFIGALLDLLKKQPGADMKRVYVTGFSNGAMMACRLGCQLQSRITAIVPVGATLGINYGGPWKGMPMMAVHGMLDEHAPLDGGIGKEAIDKVQHKSVWDVHEMWSERNAAVSWITRMSRGADHLLFETKGKLAPTQLYILPGGGHTWPGGTDPREGKDGPLITTFDTNGIGWNFCRQFSL